MGESAPESGFRKRARCGIVKPIASFRRRGDGHQSSRPIRMRQKRERIKSLAEWMRELKTSQPCVDCGGFFHPAAMTFDHLPGTIKRAEVSNLLHSGYRQVLLDEIAKCELVCANCHAVRTFNREQSNQVV